MAWLGRRWIADLPALGLALISSFLAGLYQRSHAGYYDTDILNVFFPLMIVVLFVRMAEDVRVRWLVWAVVLALLYDWWYGSARAMLFALAGGLCVHTLLYARTLPSRWQALIVFGLAVVPLPPAVRLPGLLLLMLALHVVLPRLTPGQARSVAGTADCPLFAPVALLFLPGWLPEVAQIRARSQPIWERRRPLMSSPKGTLHFAAATERSSSPPSPPACMQRPLSAGKLLGWIAGGPCSFSGGCGCHLLLPVLAGLIGFLGDPVCYLSGAGCLLGFAWGVYQLSGAWPP